MRARGGGVGLVALALLAVLAGCGSDAATNAGGQTPLPGAPTGVTTPSGPAPTASVVTGGAPGSTVTGRLIVRGSSGSAAGQGVRNRDLGLYPHAFQPGPNARAGSAAAGGTPVARTSTDAKGRFVFREVPSGQWFLTASDSQGGVVSGRWVRVTSDSGVAVDLVVCPGCPPLQ